MKEENEIKGLTPFKIFVGFLSGELLATGMFFIIVSIFPKVLNFLINLEYSIALIMGISLIILSIILVNFALFRKTKANRERKMRLLANYK